MFWVYFFNVSRDLRKSVEQCVQLGMQKGVVMGRIANNEQSGEKTEGEI